VRGVRRSGPTSLSTASCPDHTSNVAESIAVESITRAEPADALARAARVELLQAVADPVRWAVLEELADTTRCVCDLRDRVPVPANLLSYHLKVLREAGLVTTSRRGRWIDYTLAPDALDRMRAALPAAPQAGGHDGACSGTGRCHADSDAGR